MACVLHGHAHASAGAKCVIIQYDNNRSDGTKQLTYNGWPLDHYALDRIPGNMKGEGIGGVWYAYQVP